MAPTVSSPAGSEWDESRALEGKGILTLKKELKTLSYLYTENRGHGSRQNKASGCVFSQWLGLSHCGLDSLFDIQGTRQQETRHRGWQRGQESVRDDRHEKRVWCTRE